MYSIIFLLSGDSVTDVVIFSCAVKGYFAWIRGGESLCKFCNLSLESAYSLSYALNLPVVSESIGELLVQTIFNCDLNWSLYFLPEETVVDLCVLKPF